MIRGAINIFIGMVVSTTVAVGQVSSGYELPAELKEISGLEQLNDSIFVAINDSGNPADLFLITPQGKQLKKVRVENARNVDWEDITSDGTYLYIGDVGNNRNTRRDLCVYKVRISDVLSSDKVNAEKINFSYREQQAFPPNEAAMDFDCEAIAYRKNELWIFTKPNSDPWTGYTHIYRVSTTPGTYVAEYPMMLMIGKEGWWVDAITAADIHGDKLYLSTYNRVIQFKFAENKPELQHTVFYNDMTQKESILLANDGNLYVADEKQILVGGGKIYKMETKNDE